MAIVALLFIIVAIIFGIARKINVGLVSLGLAIILALIGHVKVTTISSGFPTSLFVTLLGTTFLFSIMQENKTLELMSKKIIGSVGKRTFLIPIVVYLVSYVMSAVGPGGIPVIPVMVLLAVVLSMQMGVSPIMMGVLADLGAVGGTASPIALTGILIKGLMTSDHLAPMTSQLFIGNTIANLICAIFVYFVFRGYKLNSNADISLSNLPKFNSQQKMSLIGLAAMIIAVVGFKLDVGYVSFTVALILILLKAADEKAAIKLVPWSILIMVGGVNVLMYVVEQLGGITLLANILASFMNKYTAAPIMGLTAGIMALFSSGNGVVIPTLIPTIPGIVSKVGGANVHQIVLAITSCAIFTASPLTEAGGLIMATYTQGKQVSEKEQNSLFGKLFLVTFAMIAILVVATLIGLFRPFA